MRALGMAIIAGCMLAGAGTASATGFTLTYSGWLNGSSGYSTTLNTGSNVDTSSGSLVFTNTFPPANTVFGVPATQTFTNPGDSLYVTGGTVTHFAAPTPFTITGQFDNTSSNEVASLNRPGFAAYRMTNVTFNIAGVTYTVPSTVDLAAAIFDRSSGYGSPTGHYGLGVLHNGTSDTGFSVGDFSSASTDFTIATLTDTVMSGYNGAGFGDRLSAFRFGENAAVDNIELIDPNNVSYTLGVYFSYQPALYDAQGNLMTSSAQIVPEPASMAMLGLAFAGVASVRRRRT